MTIEPAQKPKYHTIAGLLAMGWTRGAIDAFLGTPDMTRPNPDYPRGARIQLFRADRVEAAKATPEFADWWEQITTTRSRPRKPATPQDVSVTWPKEYALLSAQWGNPDIHRISKRRRHLIKNKWRAHLLSGRATLEQVKQCLFMFPSGSTDGTQPSVYHYIKEMYSRYGKELPDPEYAKVNLQLWTA
jgi:hypothetical protein